jgi:tetratricopeptide (TPR) repeat protein
MGRFPRSVFGALLFCLLASFAAAAPDDPSATAAALTKSGFDRYYMMDYDGAIRDFERAAEASPDDPFAVNHLLSAVLFRELYRAGALDTSLYSNNSFLDRRQFPIDPAARERIRQLADRALVLSEARLSANPKDVDALYARGVTRSLRATYIGLVEKSWYAALKSAWGARNDHEEVLRLSPGYADAKAVVGIHEYISANLPFFIKVLAQLTGHGGSKEKGLSYLADAGAHGKETSVDARIMLAVFLRREQRFLDALQVARGLSAAYPRNFLLALEEANILNDAGRGPEAIAAYRKVLDAGRAGSYFDPHLELAAWGLGESLRGQRQIAAAAEAYDSVLAFPRTEPELRRKATLAAGEMYDLLQKRDLAVQRYNAVIAAQPDSDQAQTARKRLREPYRLP